MKDVYLYEPVQKDWKPAYESLLMGVQASMWTEFCSSAADVEYQLFPRLLALADVAWAQKGTKDWPAFLTRLDRVLPHVETLGMTCARSMYNIDHKVTSEKKRLRVMLSCIRPDVEIRYTCDGTEPTAASPRYDDSFTVDAATCVKAATFAQGVKMGKTLTLDMQWNLATGKRVIVPDGVADVLTNGVRGSLRHTDSEWVGWYDQDASFVLDLGKKTQVNEVSLGCITNSGMAVHKPAVIRLSVSNDKKNYRQIGEIVYTPEEIFANRTAVEDALFDNLDVKTRYLRFEVKNPGVCPKGDVREGQKIWMYFDEVIVK